MKNSTFRANLNYYCDCCIVIYIIDMLVLFLFFFSANSLDSLYKWPIFSVCKYVFWEKCWTSYKTPRAYLDSRWPIFHSSLRHKIYLTSGVYFISINSSYFAVSPTSIDGSNFFLNGSHDEQKTLAHHFITNHQLCLFLQKTTNY